VDAGTSYWIHGSPEAALEWLLRRRRPAVIGVGELHQKTGSKPVRSAISRFSGKMLDTLAKRGATDLVVETWITEGRCGKQEKQVARKVEQTTERPPETENEVIRLLRRAKGLGIRPHILTVGCREYAKLLDAERGGKLNLEKLLDLITRHLKQKTLQVLRAPRRPADKKPLVAVYGGALHNDLFPLEDLEMFSFGAALQEATRGRYLELDLYVPEYVEADAQLKKKPWYPLLATQPRNKVLLVERGGSSYLLVLRANDTQK
jgi:hypothetical protein